MLWARNIASCEHPRRGRKMEDRKLKTFERNRLVRNLEKPLGSLAVVRTRRQVRMNNEKKSDKRFKGDWASPGGPKL